MAHLTLQGASSRQTMRENDRVVCGGGPRQTCEPAWALGVPGDGRMHGACSGLGWRGSKGCEGADERIGKLIACLDGVALREFKKDSCPASRA